MLFNNCYIKKEIKGKIKNTSKTNENEIWHTKTYRIQQKWYEKITAIQTYTEKLEKLKQSNLTPKGTRKGRTSKAQSQEKEENNKDQRGNKQNRD